MNIVIKPMVSRAPQSRYTMKLPMDVLDRIFEMLLPGHLYQRSSMTGDFNIGQLKWPLCGESIEPIYTAEPQEFLHEVNPLRSWRERPVDLMQCRLTCKVFNSLATRWIWRRLTIHDESSTPGRSSKAVEICTFLEKHPEIGAHVRMLRLYADSTLPTWHRVLPLFTNIRALEAHLTFKETKNPETDVSQLSVDIFHDLLSTPSLHTLIVRGKDHPFLFEEPIYTIKNLWLYHRPEDEFPFEFSSTPSLENVYIAQEDGDGYDIPIEDMPWDTLKQLAVALSPDNFQGLAESFETWKASNPSRRSLLTELSVFGYEYDLDRIEIALNAFGGQPLTKLILRSPAVIITPLYFERIVTSFPDLVELTLDSSDIDSECLLQRWRGSLADYARALGKLQNLKFLEWNYITPFSDNDDGVISNAVQMLRTISEHCPSLVRVNFLPRGDSGDRDSYFSFLLVRDEERDNNGWIFLPVGGVNYDPEVRFYGESWYGKYSETTWWNHANYTDV